MHNLIIEKLGKSCLFKAGVFCVALLPYSMVAQMVSNGEMKISEGVLVSVKDYGNQAGGKLVNDGEFHVFGNWNNDGIVTFTSGLEGTTYFAGTDALGQVFTGEQVSDFNNVVFDNTSSKVPFYLGTNISVDKVASFNNGIIESKDYDSEVVFNENASHQNTSDLSFVRGRVVKNGSAPFEYPVGDGEFYRPAGQSSEAGNTIVTEYFNEDSNDLYPHASVGEGILEIDNTEYWTVAKTAGDENIVLSLAVDEDTSPDSFVNLPNDKQLTIVRWDTASSKWVLEGGVVTPDPILKGTDSEKLVTNLVSGYGIFTLAMVEKAILPPPSEEAITIYNSLSPNSDGKNDYFHIKGINNFPNNTVEIYNRWGVKVFETQGYDESGNVFSGYSEGRATISKDESLPSGTYFYIIKYENIDGTMVSRKGYLYISAS